MLQEGFKVPLKNHNGDHALFIVYADITALKNLTKKIKILKTAHPNSRGRKLNKQYHSSGKEAEKKIPIKASFPFKTFMV